jgi:hypothetical protein
MHAVQDSHAGRFGELLAPVVEQLTRSCTAGKDEGKVYAGAFTAHKISSLVVRSH